MRRTLAVAVAIWLCTGPQHALAQAIRGTVVDNADRALTGVVVLLLDPAAKEVGRVLSNERGEYRLTVPRPGSYRVRTLRIGFQSVTTEPIALTAGDDIVRRLVLTGTAFALDTVRALGRNACRVVAGDSTTVIAALWDQVRSALIATQLTLSARTIFATTLRYERTMDQRSQRIGGQSVDIRADYARQPWRSMTAASLRRNGYVFTDAGDIRTYYAPGLDVLLSDEFIEDHCLRIAPSSTDTRLGIEFEPNADRRKFAEIRGTLWLDRASSELRDMEYRYVNVSSEEERVAGGTIGFTRMRDGMWAISRWNIRMPTMVYAPVYDNKLKVVNRELRVDSIKVTGGELVLAVLSARAGRDTIWMRPPLKLNGVVIDSLSGRSVPGAIVALGGTVQMDTTDSRGRFTIHGVLPGRYAVDVRTPSLDSVNTVDQRTILFSDSSMTLNIRVPNASMIAGSICGERAEGGIVLGSVTRDRDTTAVPNARVRAEWTEFAITSSGGGAVNSHKQMVETRTDSRGVYRMCGLPTNTALTFTASADSSEASPLPVRMLDRQRFARADLILRRPRVTTSTFAGLVVDSASDPLSDVEVSLPELGLTTRTDARGAFRIIGLIPGTHKVVARRIGYGVLESALEFGPGQTTDRRIILARVTVLDSLLTTANRNNDPLMREFDENMRMGLGRFITREDIQKREGALLSSFLFQTPGLRLMTGQGGEYVMGSRPMRCNAIPPSLAAIKSARPELPAGRLCDIYYVPSTYEANRGVPIACFSRVYQDNQLMNPGTPTPPFNLRDVPTTQVEAIEWYTGPAQVPAKYTSRNSTCGVLVIHTRRFRPPG